MSLLFSILFIIFLVFYYLLHSLEFSKYIVVSDKKGILKLHSNAVHFSKANEIQHHLEEQYRNQRVNGYCIDKSVRIIKYSFF